MGYGRLLLGQKVGFMPSSLHHYPLWNTGSDRVPHRRASEVEQDFTGKVSLPASLPPRHPGIPIRFPFLFANGAPRRNGRGASSIQV